LTAPYFHSGKVWDLKQAVGIMGNAQLGQELSDLEVNKIVSFLKSLTGRMPEVTYPELPLESAATPRPSANVKR
jgi:cytochrome c peroxidase